MSFQFGSSDLLIRYDCAWENSCTVDTQLFEYLLQWLERCAMMSHQALQPTCFASICLGVDSNETNGRLVLVLTRKRESGIMFWTWTFMKYFDVASEYFDDSLDRLYHNLDSMSLPFLSHHHEMMSRKFQFLFDVSINMRYGKISNISIVRQVVQLCLEKVRLHFTDFIWTFKQFVNVPSVLWNFPIRETGNFRDRSTWIEQDWTRIQQHMEWAWDNFKVLRSNSLQLQQGRAEGSSCDFIVSKIDNFVPAFGVGSTFEWNWNWPFRKMGVAFYCRNRTKVSWGVHPFISMIEEKNEDFMKLFGSEMMIVRFTAQGPGDRPCDTVIFEAECTKSVLEIREQDLRSSLLYLFGHFLESCLYRMVENLVFDGLGQFGPHFWQYYALLHECCQLPHQETFPFRLPDEPIRLRF
jgi:hypothetical protein